MSSSGSPHDNSTVTSDLHGVETISWDPTLSFSDYDPSALVIDLDTLPVSSSSTLAALSGGLITPQTSFCNTSDWSAFPLPATTIPYSCDDLSTGSAGLDTLTMPSAPDNFYSPNTSHAMEKGTQDTFQSPLQI